jgi:hypothetical protein
MKYRPDESTLISWMYGELDETERAKVEAFFSENPEELRKIRQVQAVRDVMANIGDKEVIAPPLIQEDHPRVVPIWNTASFRTAMSIAASFILIIVAGKLLGPEISYANNELRISFGPRGNQPPADQVNQVQGMSPTEVQQMIDASVKGSEARIDERLVSAQARLDRTVRSAMTSAPAGIDSLAREMSKASESQIQTFVASLREDNLQMMRQYLELSASEQRAYMENLLVDFSKWQQEQRNQDMQILFTRVNSIENNTNQLKEETEQILASIISNSGVSEKQAN